MSSKAGITLNHKCTTPIYLLYQKCTLHFIPRLSQIILLLLVEIQFIVLLQPNKHLLIMMLNYTHITPHHYLPAAFLTLCSQNSAISSLAGRSRHTLKNGFRKQPLCLHFQWQTPRLIPLFWPKMTEEWLMAMSASAVYSLREEDYTSQGIAILYRR